MRPTKGPGGGMSTLKLWLARNKQVAAGAKAVATFVAGSASMLITVRAYLHTAVDQAVTKRLAPYERLAAGLSLNQGEN